MKLNPKTTSDSVVRPNGRTAEDEFCMLPEVILGTTIMEKETRAALVKPYTNFRYLYIMYSNLESLSCMNSMLFPTRFITGKKNELNLHARISEASYAYAQIGFTSPTTLEVSSVAGGGTYPNVYVKVCGIK